MRATRTPQFGYPSGRAAAVQQKGVDVSLVRPHKLESTFIFHVDHLDEPGRGESSGQPHVFRRFNVPDDLGSGRPAELDVISDVLDRKSVV